MSTQQLNWTEPCGGERPHWRGTLSINRRLWRIEWELKMSCFQWGEAVNSSLRGLSADAMQQPFSQSKLIHLRVKGVRQRGCKVDIRDVQSTLGRSHSWANIRPNNNNRRQAADFPSQRALQPHVEGGAIWVKGRFAPGRSALIFLYWNHHDVLGIST